jgi:hypothetical protein
VLLTGKLTGKLTHQQVFMLHRSWQVNRGVSARDQPCMKTSVHLQARNLLAAQTAAKQTVDKKHHKAYGAAQIGMSVIVQA